MALSTEQLPGLRFELRLTASAFQIISCLLCSKIFGNLSRAMWALDPMLHGLGTADFGNPFPLQKKYFGFGKGPGGTERSSSARCGGIGQYTGSPVFA